MMNIYNSLSSGLSSCLKICNVGSLASSNPPVILKNRTSVKWFASLLFLLIGFSNYAQTTVISGSAEGSFEGATLAASGWTSVQGTASANNNLAIGNAATIGFTPTDGTKGVFVTTNGTSRGYNTAAGSWAWIYRDVTLNAGETLATLKMDMAGNPGDTGYDGIVVGISDTSFTASITTGATGVMSGTVVPNMSIATTATSNGFMEDGNYSTVTNRTFTFSPAGLGNTSASVTKRIWIGWRCDGSGGTTPMSFDKVVMTTSLPATLSAVQGGLWSSPATWGGTVPAAGNDVVIPAGVIVTVDQLTTYRNLTINGRVQWNASSNAMTLLGNLVINSGGSFLPYTTASTGQTINIAGNFQNDGYANLAVASTAINFNGSGSTLSGSGIFQGDGTNGIIRALSFQNTGSNSISTTQNLIVTSGIAHTAGSLNTGGKLKIDNTAQIYGQAFNISVASISVNNMGSAYSVAPVVFGTTVTQWTNITGVLGTRYVSGNNVYVCTTAANIGPAAPTHTSGVSQNLLWLGTVGTLGNPYPFNAASTVGTQYFLGDNLYVATVANALAANTAANAPVHTSGIVGGYLYVGTVAKVSVNYDATTQTVRSLNIVNAGNGYSSAPSAAFSVGVAGGTGSGATATAVFFQQTAGTASSLFQKSGGAATISGGLIINSDQGASASNNEQSSSGVGGISTTNGGVNYTVAPQIGFAGPTALNLIINPGSGYTAAPTITVSGGTIVQGTAYTSSSFSITVNGGKVQAVYLTNSSAVYSVPPTLTMSDPASGTTATLAFPAGCWPAATPVIGTNGQLVNFNITNSGYGYVTAPSAIIGTTTATTAGGTFTTVATAPTTRIALYNLTTNNFIPAGAAVVQGDDAAIPANRKINTLSLGSFSSGINLTSDLILFGTSPLSLTASTNAPGSVINLGGHNLLFTWNTYAGTTATFGATSNAYIKNGSMTLTGRGGSTSFNFPFSGTLNFSPGSTPTSNSTGSNITRITVSDTAAPTNATVGTSFAAGSRAFRVQYANIGATGFQVLPTTGTNPTVTLNFNNDDALTAFTQDALLISESAGLTGPWSIKSASSGTGAITSTTAGSRTTATAAPGPIAPTGDNYYAWSVSAPTITDFSPLTVCANSGTFTITGTNLTGITNLQIGGTAVTSFTIVSPTQITGIAGNGTNGFVSFVKGSTTVTGTQSITVAPSPSAPSVSPATASVILGGSPNVTASGSGGTFNWYSAATGGTLLHTGALYSLPVCASTTLFVSENNGSCDGPRTAVPVTVQAIVVTASTPIFCGTGGTSVLNVSPVDPSISYTWTASTGSLSATSGNSVEVTVTASSEIHATATSTLGGCTATGSSSVSVFALPTATVTTSANGVCPGTSATINSGLAAGNFTSTPITFGALTAPVNAVSLVVNGVAPPGSPAPQTYPTNTFSAYDDGGWADIPMGFNFNFFGTSYNKINVGTNGTVQFGTFNANSGSTAPYGLSDFLFTTLPSATEPFNMIAVLAMDNDLSNTTDGGTVKYWTEGTAPNRKFVVSYINARRYSLSSTSTYSTSQAIFYETTGVVEVHVTGSNNTDANKLIGINNGTGTIGALAFASGTTANANNPITTPKAYRFSPPSNYTTTWTAFDTVTNTTTTLVDATTNTFSLAVSPIHTTVYTISYTNQTTGCTNALNSAQVTMNIIDDVAPATTAVSNVASVCFGGSANLSLTGNVNNIGNTDGLTYQWQVSTNGGTSWDDISAATSATTTVTPTPVSSYRCLVKACNGTAVASTTVSIGYTNVIDSTTAATRCGAGVISLSATTSSSGASIRWYAAQTGGTALFTGSPYTPTVSTTTTYYVAAETTGPACSSPRVAVTATVDSPPAINLTGGSSATICNGSSATLTTDATANYNTFSISPATGSHTGGGVFTFTPTATTVYTVSASQSSGALCATTFTYTVNVNTTTVFAATSSPDVCVGNSVTLTATTIVGAPGTANLGGAGTSSIGGDNGNPYRSGNGTGNQIRTQLLVRASELVAAGITTGNITSLAFTTTASSSGTVSNFTIALGHTSATALTTTFDTSSVTQVFSQASFTPLSSGLNVHTFSTPFNWDGTSNLLINVCQTNDVSGTATVTTETLSYNATSHKAGTTTGCTDATSSAAMTSRPIMQFGAVVGSTGPGTLNYAWTSTPSGFTASGASVSASPTVTTTYHVVGTNPSTTCVSAPVSVTVNATNASAQITAQPAEIQTRCIGSTATFAVTATGVNLTYQWRRGTTNLTDGGTISGATTATLTITGLVAGDAGSDYNVVIGSDCGAPTTSDNAMLTLVTPLAGISASATTICQGESVTLTENGGSATSWSWAPGGATSNSISVSPTSTTNYVVTATTQVAGCTATANVTVTVNQTPSAVTVTATATGINDNTVCNGNVVTLTATGGSGSTSGTVGSATTLTGSQSQPTAFCNRFEHYWMQMVFTPAELSAAGVQPGAINGIAFNIDAQGSANNVTDFKVRMGAAPAATLSTFQTSGLSLVYAINTYDINIGVNNIAFNTPYVWDGTSNIIVDVRNTGIDSADNTTTYYTATTGNTCISAITTSTFAGSDDFVASNPSGTTSVNRLNTTFNFTTSITNTWTTSPPSTLYTNVEATTGNEYVPGTSAAVVYARPSVETTYIATAANGSCTNDGEVTISVNPLPAITLANSVTSCKGTGVTITIPEINNNYSWSPSTGLSATTGSQVLANPTATTTYTVTITNTSTFCQSTDEITVNVTDPGEIVTQPTNEVAAGGFGTSYTVAGTAGITYTYQWQIKTGSTTYSNLSDNAQYSGVNSAVLTINNAGTGTALNNASYRCLLTPPSPCSALISDDALLTVSNTGIATNPANVNICLPTPSTAQFSITTNGDEAYLVEWQVSADGGLSYDTISLIDIEDTFLYNGPNTTAVPGLTFEHPLDSGNATGSNYKILNVSGITDPTSLMFKAIVNEALESGVATLTVAEPITFSSNLSTAEITRCKNPLPATATDLSVTASGTISSVEWRYSTTPGGTFSGVVTNNTPQGATYVASSTGNTYSLAVTTDASTPAGSYYYKAFVTGPSACGSTPTQSAMATITVANPAVAIASTANSYCTPGDAVVLTASGAATYSWTSSPAGFTSASNSASVTPTVSTVYTVVGTDANGCTNSATVSIGVGNSFTVSASAAPTTVCPSAAVALTAAPTGAGSTTYMINTIPYQFNAVSGAFTPLSGTTVSSGLADDEDDLMSGNLTPGAGFSFNYGGTNYTTFRVSSNGQLVFGTAGTSTITNNLASSTTTHRPGLAPLWDDLILSSGVNYQLSGTAPNRVLTVEWLDTFWNYNALDPVLSFQVKLYETTNVIEYVYREGTGAVNTGSSGASIGLMGTASGNYISLQSTTASPTLSATTSKNDIGTKPATGQIYRFTPVTPVTYTYAWTSTPSGFTGTGLTTTANPTVSTVYNVTATSSQGCQATNTASVTVNSDAPIVTALPAALNLCQGATATFAVTATSATALTYQWKRNGSPLANGSGVSGATTSTLTITGTTPANSASYSVDVSNCTTVTSTPTVLTVNPLPTATLTGTATVCQNDAQPSVTFTGAAGTAPYTFTYKLNGGANQTIATTSGNSVTLAVPTTVAGTFTYTLVSVQDSSSSTCSQTQAGIAIIKVNALPAAPTLTPVATVCAGGTLNFVSSAVAPVTGVSNYSFAASSGTYTPITGGTVVSSSATWDDTPAAIAAPIGFPFTFNGVNYTTCNINLNGYISFGTTTTTNNYTPISTLIPNETGIIAGFARDLQGVATTGNIRYESTPTEFIVQWSNARRYNTSANAESFSFQIHLVKDTNQAYIVYGTFSNAISASTTVVPQVGLRGTAIADFKNVEVLNTGNWNNPSLGTSNTATAYYNQGAVSVKPASGLTYTFTPPPAPVYAWSGPNGFTSAVQNPSITNATVDATGTYTLQVTNGNGCKATSTVNATVTAQPIWYLDADGDHYYTGAPQASCTSPGPGFTTTGILGGNDCNDTPIVGATIYPNAPEICWNGILENCLSTISAGCPNVIVNMTPSYNGTTLPSLATGVPAVPYTYLTYTNLKYRFSITNLTTGETSADIIQTSRYVTIPASLHLYGASYSIKASAVINEEIVPFAGNTIIVNAPTVQLITLSSASCGATLASLTSTLTANPALNATGYTFRIRVNDGGDPLSATYYISQSSTRFVSANSFTGFPLQYNSSYKVSVQYTFTDPVSNLPVVSGYGAECTVNTPGIPVTTIASPVCGSRVTAMNAAITATSGQYSTGYQFRIRLFSTPTGPYYTTPVTVSRFSSLVAFQGITLAYGTDYAVSVRYSVQNGATTAWSDYGPECKVSTPFFPTTAVVASQCGQSNVALNYQFNISPYPGFPQYVVKLDLLSQVDETIDASEEITTSYSHFRLNQFSIAQLGRNYNVSIAIKLNGVQGDFHTTCDISTATPAKSDVSMVVPFKATAYPNPFANNFMLDVKSSSQSVVNVKVYDMIGRMIEQKDVRMSDLETTTIGNNYPSGVYNVVVSQEDSVQTVRVVKR